MSDDSSRRAWEHVRAHICAAPPNTVLALPRRSGFPHPRDAGARLTATWPVGQTADYLLDGSPRLVVREFPDRWETFIEATLTSHQALRVDDDPTGALYLAAAMLGGVVGTSVSNKKEGVLLGAGLGLLFAAVVDVRRRSRT